MYLDNGARVEIVFVNMLTEEQAIKRSAPSDWLYVNNFKDPYHPIAIKVTNGQGKNIIKQVDRSIRFFEKRYY